ncbi:MAG: hypothetical protein HC829_08040 [Bacteroidales bacterium]|nr:hypothetical protein [Bacteroidales bacterium]
MRPDRARFLRPEPKTLEELQAAVAVREKGYDIHHIVEQTPADRDSFARTLIDAPENLVRVPTLKHWEITAWFMQGKEDYGGLSPREYLLGKDWAERVRVGRQALIDVGVLKP